MMLCYVDGSKIVNLNVFDASWNSGHNNHHM